MTGVWQQGRHPPTQSVLQHLRRRKVSCLPELGCCPRTLVSQRNSPVLRKRFWWWWCFFFPPQPFHSILWLPFNCRKVFGNPCNGCGPHWRHRRNEHRQLQYPTLRTHRNWTVKHHFWSWWRSLAQAIVHRKPREKLHCSRLSSRGSPPKEGWMHNHTRPAPTTEHRGTEDQTYRSICNASERQ